MQRFFLNIFNRTGCSIDDEGHELSDLPAARSMAVEGIRSILSGEAREGMLDLCGRVEIADATGAILATVAFAEAFELHLPETP